MEEYKTEQNLTNSVKVNPATGLTPMQEQTAMMLASGEKITNVAEKIGVSRTTIYQWQTLLTFQCFYNQRCEEVKGYLKDSVMSLCDEAVQAIRDTLNSENEAVRFKCAMWLVNKISEMEVGEVDPYKVVKEECTESEIENWEVFNEGRYRKKLEELSLPEIEK